MLKGQTPLTLIFNAADANLPIDQVDLFLDGTFFQTVTKLAPAPGNNLTVTLNGDTVEQGLTNAVKDNDARFPPDFRLSRSGRARPQ